MKNLYAPQNLSISQTSLPNGTQMEYRFGIKERDLQNNMSILRPLWLNAMINPMESLLDVAKEILRQ